MEWVQRMNDAIAYIEAHLTEEIDPAQLGRLAGCSAYHFQRVFSYLADVPLGEYIRRRRMTLAAVDLQGGGKKVLDIALKYGYDSPTAFNRAFQSVHGLSPSAAQGDGVPLRSYPPIVFAITIKGETAMDYRIERKEAFRIVGISRPLEMEIEKNFAVVPAMWQSAAMDGTLQKLASMMHGAPMGVLGVSACNSEEQWRYFIAVASDRPVEAPLEEYTVPAATWAIFPGTGSNPQGIQELERRIVTQWLPSSGYEYGNAPDIEVYISPDPQNAVYEVWIPVVKKEA